MKQHEALSMLIRAMEIGPSNAILEQEAQGQRDFVNSAVLPKRCSCERADLEAAGIVFGDDADDLFVNVTLPAGWKKEPTSHSMWSSLLDDRGRTRAAIFYKAAFYDRKAHISSIFRAINVSCKYDDDETVKVVVTRGDAVLFETEAISHALKDQAYFTTTNAAEAAAIAWTDANYPDWRSTAAYW